LWSRAERGAEEVVEELEALGLTELGCERACAFAEAVEPIGRVLLGEERNPIGHLVVVEGAGDAAAAARRCKVLHERSGDARAAKPTRPWRVVVQWTHSLADGYAKAGQRDVSRALRGYDEQRVTFKWSGAGRPVGDERIGDELANDLPQVITYDLFE
jgi:hypothetical protein